MSKLTPMMQQYVNIKNKYYDSILFYRLGDFYEMFSDDAIIASKELEITLTGRNSGQGNKIPMCGVPFHSADAYISKLVSKGYKVAICEQVEDASVAKGIVKRDVVRIITPGTITDTKSLDEKNNNYLCAIYEDNNGVGISYVDITTGEFNTTKMIGSKENVYNLLIDELAKINPSEIICNNYLFNNTNIINRIKSYFINIVTSEYYNWAFEYDTANKKIKDHMKVLTLNGYGLEDNRLCVSSTGALLEYLSETQKVMLTHLNNINYYSIDNYMVLDYSTRRNLELTETIKDKNKKGSLLWLLDKTCTAMGSRLLKKWVEQPLICSSDIENRYKTVEYFVNNIHYMDEIKSLLKEVYDLERLIGRISYGNCNGRDLIALKNSLIILPEFKKYLLDSQTGLLLKYGNEIDILNDIYQIINESIVEEPPITIKEGNLINKEYNEELSEILDITFNGKLWIQKLEISEKERTGIKSLKVGYNKVFGYYIEVTKSNLKLVPDDYIRKQTLSNCERYITPELKEMESKVLGAEERNVKLQYEIFINIRDRIKKEIKRIQGTAQIISQVDCLRSLGQVAFNNNYILPNLNNEGIIEIINGRHPVVEKMLDNELFVPNDTLLDMNKNRVAIITGPNMAGKSTFMRQVALITLMAQIGSFVPAERCNLCIVDRIFTRVGASDDLSQGKSTFMVEMSEVANILNNSTENSLLILDEIGRGTSTYDGLSIAWAVVEYIANKDKIGAKTLFATHYHELTDLEGKVDGINNYNIVVKEDGEDIVFLRKISKGGADKSYGIEVAKLAGVPNEVIYSAKEILNSLQSRNNDESSIEIEKEIAVAESTENYLQLDMFNLNNNIIEKLNKIDLMNTTPIEAMTILHSLIKEAKEV